MNFEHEILDVFYMKIQTQKPTYRYHNGFRMPMGFPPEGFTSGISYLAQPNDTFIVTYPKCGTTWTQYIVWLICHDGNPLSASQKLSDDIPHLEEVGKEIIATLAQPRFIKTHLPYPLTPYHPQAKYLYIARNPFDCAVSFYHHTRGFVRHYDFAEGTFDEFFECFIKGEVDFGDYFDHLLSWYHHKNDKNVLFLTYEAMKADSQKAIVQIANFMGEKYAQRVKNETFLNQVYYYSSFAKMSENQQRWASKRPNDVPPFIRKGKIGDWKTLFSPVQIQQLTTKFRERTQGTDLANLWSDIH